MKCAACNGTGEIAETLEGVGAIRTPCQACNGDFHAKPACDHSDRTPAFMRGSFYCNKCQAKLHVHDDGTIEVKGQS